MNSRPNPGLLTRIWDSPTLTSWGSLATRLATTLVLLPFVLAKFSVEDATLWMLFSSLAALQIVADIGFSPTFIRAIANAVGGAGIEKLSDLRQPQAVAVGQAPQRAHEDTLARVIATLEPTYRRIGAITFVLVASAGTYALLPSILGSHSPKTAWLAWSFVVLGTTLSLWGNAFVSYLLGTERIATLRRWETLFALASIVTAVTVVGLEGSLLTLVLVQQCWVVAAVGRNLALCRQDGRFLTHFRAGSDREVLRGIWPNAWRSGVGVLMSFGVVQASGLVYARLGSVADLASYLLALRAIQTISALSQVPFYSKIPALSRLRANGAHTQQLFLAKQGMLISHITFCFGFLAAGFGAPPFLSLIDSQTRFASPYLWTLLGAAFFAERVGAMHLQLYSTTNHIIWHIANGLTGLSMMALAWIAYPHMGVAAFPMSMLVSYVSIYCVISLQKSYRTFSLSFLQFDLTATVTPAIVTATLWSLVQWIL